jgi:hypothetical protein
MKGRKWNVVSIPYRYCKNLHSVPIGAGFCAFQFLIGTVKTPDFIAKKSFYLQEIQ